MGVFTYFLRDLEQILFPNRDQHAIPAMDGGYTPNDRLDALSLIGAPIPGADDIAEGGDGAIYVSAGKQVLRLAGAGYEARSVFAEFDGAAGGLAFHPDGRLLVCVAGRGLAAGAARRPAACPRATPAAGSPGSIRPKTSRCNASPALPPRPTAASS